MGLAWTRVGLVLTTLIFWFLSGPQPGHAAMAVGPIWSLPRRISSSPMDSWYPIIVADTADTLHCIWTDQTLGSGRGDVYYARRVPGNEWSTPLNLSESIGEASQPTIAVDAQQTVHVAWSDNTPGNREIYYVSRPPGANWGAIQKVTETEADSVNPYLIAGPNGHLHLIWYEHIANSRCIYYSSRDPSGKWSIPQNVSSPDDMAMDFAAVVDANGTLHLAWFGSSSGNWEILYVNKPLGGNWSDPVSLSPPCSYSGQVSMAMDDNDHLHLVWSEGTSLGLLSNSDIFYRERSENGQWSDLRNLSESDGQSLYPVIAADSTGSIYVVWQDAIPGGLWSIYCISRRPDETWTDAVRLSPPDENAEEARIYAGHSVDVVWSGGVAGNWEICHVHRDEFGTWSPPIVISNTPGDSFAPYLVADTSEGLHVVWYDDTLGPYDIYYSTKVSHVVFLPNLFMSAME